MILNRKRDLKRSGIYAIKNKLNNKLYIGKSINIYERMRQHINYLNKSSKNENRYLINSWLKNGRDNFEYIVLEDVIADDNLLKQKELYWILKLDTLNRNKGYNLRLDSETRCILPLETKLKMSQGTLLYYKNNPNAILEIGINSSNFWKNNPIIKQQMASKIAKLKHKFNYEQYDLNGILIKKWNTVKEIIEQNPDYKWQNIYSVCNGYKPTIYGYKWIKVKI